MWTWKRGPIATLAWGLACSAFAGATLQSCSDDDGKPNGPVIVIAAESGAPAQDATTDAPARKKALAEDCTSDAECESNVCFLGTKTSWCALKCTAQNAASICTPPAFDGTCNNQGYCRRPG